MGVVGEVSWAGAAEVSPRDAGHSQGSCRDCCLVMTRTGARSGWTRGDRVTGTTWGGWGRQGGKEDGGRRKEERDGMEVGFWRLIFWGAEQRRKGRWEIR